MKPGSPLEKIFFVHFLSRRHPYISKQDITGRMDIMFLVIGDKLLHDLRKFLEYLIK